MIKCLKTGGHRVEATFFNIVCVSGKHWSTAGFRLPIQNAHKQTHDLISRPPIVWIAQGPPSRVRYRLEFQPQVQRRGVAGGDALARYRLRDSGARVAADEAEATGSTTSSPINLIIG